MLNDLGNAARTWWRGLTIGERLSIRVLAAVAIVALLAALAPEAAAAGGALAALGARALAYAFATSG